jgi:hypothetical protein
VRKWSVRRIPDSSYLYHVTRVFGGANQRLPNSKQTLTFRSILSDSEFGTEITLTSWETNLALLPHEVLYLLLRSSCYQQ